SFTVAVANVASTVTAPANQAANEGALASFSLGSFSDPGPDSPWAVDVNWGDSTTHTTFSVLGIGSLGTQSHTYGDNGKYTVTVTVTDKDGAFDSKTFTVTVADVAPAVAADNPSVVVNEGQTAINTGTYSDPGVSDNVTISASVGTVTKTGTRSGTWSWAFGTTDGPAQSQTVTITADDGQGGVSTATFGLTVNNIAPTATFNAPASVNEGSAFSLSLTGPSDPSSADTTAGFNYAFDCGSGYGAYSLTNTASCPTTDNGSRTVKGKIQDKDGGVSEYSTTVTINNVSPTASPTATPADEGSAVTVSLTNQSDPSSADNAAGFHYAFACDGSSLAAATYATSGTSATSTCTFADNGTFTVRGRIIDKDDGFTEYTASTTVID